MGARLDVDFLWAWFVQLVSLFLVIEYFLVGPESIISNIWVL